MSAANKIIRHSTPRRPSMASIRNTARPSCLIPLASHQWSHVLVGLMGAAWAGTVSPLEAVGENLSKKKGGGFKGFNAAERPPQARNHLNMLTLEAGQVIQKYTQNQSLVQWSMCPKPCISFKQGAVHPKTLAHSCGRATRGSPKRPSDIWSPRPLCDNSSRRLTLWP